MRFPNAMRRFPWFSAEEWLNRFTDAPRAPLAPPPPRVGLVLSCGGARGLAHVGVIQVLEREKIPVSAIMGSSMGAYVGALWAAGLTGNELQELAAEIKDRRTLLRLLDLKCPPLTGFLRGDKVRKHLEKSLGNRTLSQLNKPTYVVATNLDTVTWEVFPQETQAAAAVHASCAIPGIVSPVLLDGRRYIDGGASQPLPVSLLRDIMATGSAQITEADEIPPAPVSIIAVNVMPTTADLGSCSICSYPVPPPPPRGPMRKWFASLNRHVNLFAYGNVLDTFKRCLTSAQLRLVAEEGDRADVLIHPFFCESRWYDFENFNRYIEAGRTAAEAALPRILDLIQRPTPMTRTTDAELDSTAPAASARTGSGSFSGYA